MSRLFRRPLLLAALLISLLPCYGYDATYKYKFASDSRLNEGRWVKIGVDHTGVYEISYDSLREMGFSAPERVGVYGNGGIMNDISFIDNSGRRLFEDDPVPVPVYHADDRLYFYGRGVEDVKLSGETFVRMSHNIYSFTGTYFLSDAPKPLEMEDNSRTLSGTETLRLDGLDYVYHEKDLVHNYSGTGQLYWGESLKENHDISFPMDFRYGRRYSNPETRDVTRVRLELALCMSAGITGKLNIKFCSMNEYPDLYREKGKKNIFNYKNFRMPSTKNATLRLVYNDEGCDYLAIDYWLVTYNKELPEEADGSFRQERIAFPTVSSQGGGMATTVPEGSLAFDITNPARPALMRPEGSTLVLSDRGSAQALVVFDPAKEQDRILPGYEVVANQNLHSLAREGVELLIITVPYMREYAESIAELHRRHDGMKVAVVEPEEIYNEFTGGMPDPMAYRALAKMLYQSDVKPLKNVFFIGPIHGDYRGVEVDGPRPYGFVSMQEPGEQCESDLSNVMDFAGYCADTVPYNGSVSFMPLNVGVGILPITTPAQGELAVSKIREYLEQLYDPSIADIVNETISISCPGDALTHDIQACEIERLFRNYADENAGSRFPHTTLRIEDYGKREASQEYINLLNRGKLFSIYFGHSGPSQMAENFMQTQDFVNLRNGRLGFLFTAGCEMAMPDHGMSGLGEMCVTDSPRAMVGAITTCRTVWSSHNFDFAQKFIEAIFSDGVSPRRVCPTMGEVYATSKSILENPNELCFYYVGDPALTFPLALRPGEVTAPDRQYYGGEVVEFSGKALTDDRKATDEGFNGEAVVKICAPHERKVLQIRPVYDQAGNFQGNDTLCVERGDHLLASAKAKIKDGVVSGLRLVLPDDVDDYRSAIKTVKLPVYLSAYDPARKRAMSAFGEIELAPRDNPAYVPDAEKVVDNVPPTVKLVYDPAKRVLCLDVEDNVGVIPGIGGGRGTDVEISGMRVERAASIDYGVGSVASYSEVISVAHLPEGEYLSAARASDTSGNLSTVAECRFRVDKRPLMRLLPETTVAIGSIRFDVEGGAPSDLRLIVTDANGNEVYSGAANATEARWDCSSAAPGAYRAAVVDNSAAGAGFCSEWVSFVVVE